MKNIFLTHPNKVNETYFEHMRYALTCGTRLFFVSIGCLIHGFVPFIFVTSTSQTVIDMYENLKARNDAEKNG